MRLLAALLLTPLLPVAHAASCEQLSAVSIPHTAITTAQVAKAGNFMPDYGAPMADMPAFCRVAGVISPSSDSTIHFEVWMPVEGWNQKFLGAGNGGYAGSIAFNQMGGYLKRGYATAGSDAGHEAEAVDASWAFHHPEKVIDFGYRAVHETAMMSKAVLKAFYDHGPQHSYFDACSDGGREALMEAQRFPDDYDGILAGAPANDWTHLLASGIDVAQSLYGNPASYISAVKLPAITAAVLAACDAQDGVTDGIVNNPEACHFDPGVLLCRGAETRACLTAPQIKALKKLYSGGQDSKGKSIFPGFAPGGENRGWADWVLGPGPGGNSGSVYVSNYFRYMVYENPLFDPLAANAGEALQAAERKTAQALNATNPDLSRFHARGGKLIVYHGWNDQAISPLNSIHYFNSVVNQMTARTVNDFMRLYMVPGMEHCAGGVGPSAFGQLGITGSGQPQYGIFDALQDWVERGTAPGSLVATRFSPNGSHQVQMTRPLCAYPQIARYSGAGSTNEAGNFRCGVQ
jgi:hypothetical protein